MDPDVLTSVARVLLDVGGLLFGVYLTAVAGAWSWSRLRRAGAGHTDRRATSSRTGSGS